MLEEPKIVTRAAQPYVAIRREVVMPFGEIIGPTVGELDAWMKQNGVEGTGPLFFKYNIIDMPRLEIEFGFPTATLAKPSGNVIAGTIAAGRYFSATHWGHFDKLEQATGEFIGKARAQNLVFDSHDTPHGEAFASRLEIYPTNPDEEPDPNKWETNILFKLRD